MKHRLFRLCDAETNELQAAYLHCHNANTKIRYQAVRLYGNGYSVEHILDICACSRTRLLKWVAAYDQRGITSLLDQRTGGNRAALTPEQIKALHAEVSALFLNRVLLAYPDVPIVLFWDRAPWHQGEDIRSVVTANPRLERLRFPAGSPELNPQEHVWKATREAVSHNHCRPNLSELAEEFETHLKTTRFPCSLLDKHGHSQLCARFK